MARIAEVLTMAAATMAVPVEAYAADGILQLYSYRLIDPAQFREGYREHLRWHERNKDELIWYAWVVQSGPRRGLFVDGTAGASLAGLDARPNLSEDGADFARTAGPFAEAIDIETWRLWKQPSTATPLEDHLPSTIVDVFTFSVAPGRAPDFERAVGGLTPVRGGRNKLTWYRKIRGGTIPSYLLVTARDRWSDVDLIGATLNQIFSRNYENGGECSAAILQHVSEASVETWSYEPRLSLFPGRPLTP